MLVRRSAHLRFAAIGACAALSLSGCRFGNHEIDPPGPGAIQGYYESQIDSQITVCATKNVTSGSGTIQQKNCAQISPDAINKDSVAHFIFQETMTDPVDLAFDSASGLFTLQPPNDSNPQFFWVVMSDNSGDLQNPGTEYNPFSYLMPDTHPNCNFNMQYAAGGTYGQPNGPFTTGTTLPLSGRIAMSFDVLFSPNGNDCSQLESCYNSAAGCDATDNQVVQAEFGTFINAGVMSATDIPNVQDLEYQVSYQ